MQKYYLECTSDQLNLYFDTWDLGFKWQEKKLCDRKESTIKSLVVTSNTHILHDTIYVTLVTLVTN